MALARAYILFDEAGGEFAFDSLTGSIHGACDGDAVRKRRNGASRGQRLVSLEGEICLIGDGIPFISGRDTTYVACP